MSRWIAAALALFLSCHASAQGVYEARFGIGETFVFRLFAADGTLDVTETDGGTDVTLMCNEGSPATATNDYVDEGTAFSIALTAAEMECERIEVHINATVDNSFFITTFGDLRAFDKTRGIASGIAQATDTDAMTIAFDTDLAFGDDDLNNTIVCVTGGTASPECRLITDYAGSADEATVSTAFSADPTDDSEYIVYPAHQAFLQATAGIADVNMLQMSGDATAADNAEAVFDNTGFSMTNSEIGISGSVDVASISGDTAAADNLELYMDGTFVMFGVCDSGSTTTCVDNALTQADASQLEDRMIVFDDGFSALVETFTPGADQITTAKTAPSTRASKAYVIFPSTRQ